MKTKYISSTGLKIPVVPRVHSTNEIADTFNTWDDFFWGGGGWGGGGLPKKKCKISFYFSVKGKEILDNFAWLNAFSGYNIGCKCSSELENGL